jgi:hypothetical protein
VSLKYLAPETACYTASVRISFRQKHWKGIDMFKPLLILAVYTTLGGGAGFGAIRFLAKRSVPSAANWAVGSFCLISIISFEMCQMDRRNTVTKLRTKINEVKSRERMQTIEERDKSGAIKAVIELPEHLREKKDD